MALVCALVLVLLAASAVPEVPITCLSVVLPANPSVALESTEYPVVDETEAFTPRFVLEPTWKLLLVPTELLNCAVPLPEKFTVPGDEAVTWNISSAFISEVNVEETPNVSRPAAIRRLFFIRVGIKRVGKG
jgi:hypothetical protein